MDRAWEIAEVGEPQRAARGARHRAWRSASRSRCRRYEAELLAESYRMKVAVTEDAQEGARAFLEKRDPDWKVR